MINIIVMDGSNLRKNEKGVISIIVTMVFIIVVGLIVLGFGEVSRNQSRQTLDNQLSTASYYAAHSGIITLLDNIVKSLKNGNYPGNNSSCVSNSYPVSTFQTNSNSKITCATWTTTVSTLKWDDISVNKSQTAYIPLPSPYYLNISWRNNGFNGNSVNNNGCDGNKLNNSSDYSTNCPEAGVLRLNISTGPESCPTGTTDYRTCLSSSSQTYFLIPAKNVTSPIPTFSPSSSSPVIQYKTGSLSFTIYCPSNYPCKYINMRSIYSDSRVLIKASTDSSFIPTKSLNFTNSQGKIDVTAVTNGVARRVVVQANVAQNLPSGTSDFSIVSTKSLCKNVKVSNTNGSPDGLTFDNFGGYISSTYPLNGPCKSN